MNNPEKPATLCTQNTGRGQAKQKPQHIKTKPMSNTDPTKLLRWTESGAMSQEMTGECGVANRQAKNKFHLKAYT
jgi:hypothetical protein